MTTLLETAAEDMIDLVKRGKAGAAVTYLDDPEAVPIYNWSYWKDRDAYEALVVATALRVGTRRLVFATTTVIYEDEDRVYMRPPDPALPLRGFESLAIWLFSVDLDRGLEVGKVDVDLSAGQLTFGDLMVLEGEHQTLEAAPGYGILQKFAASADIP